MIGNLLAIDTKDYMLNFLVCMMQHKFQKEEQIKDLVCLPS